MRGVTLIVAGLLPLVACEPTLGVTVRPSSEIPSAFRAEWDGPAGTARLFVGDAADEGAGRQVLTTAAVDAGRSGLPIALLPVGRDYAVRVEVEDEDGQTWTGDAATLRVPDAPDVLGLPHLEFVDPERSELAAGGYTLTHRYAGAAAASDAISFILNGDGEVVWWMDPMPTGHRVVRGRPSDDLGSILVLLGETGFGDDYVHRVSIDGERALDTVTPDASHDFNENGDGTLTWIGYERSKKGLIPGVPYPVVSDVLVTGPEGGADASAQVTGFSFFDDFPSEPEIVCDHQEVGDFIPGAVEWTHANSLVRSPNDDGFLLMVRFLDALLMIDDAGKRVWQVGGVDATLTPTSEAAIFQHAHFSDAWLDEAGALHVLIFDNGNHRPEPVTSRVIELRVDPGLGTYELVRELPDPFGRFTSFLGDARRLPGGNILVTWTPQGEIVEYTPEGDEVWKLVADASFGRVNWAPTLSLH